MKQTFYYAIALTVMMAVGINCHAASWRVNSNTTRGAQFANINAAMSSADVQDGDTLYLDPGCNLTAQQNVTKRVTIIGPGYLHSTFPYAEAKISGTLYLRSEGIKVQGTVMDGTTNIAANNVVIERCHTKTISYYGSNCQNAVIRQCRINGSVYGNGETSTATAFWTIENCQIWSAVTGTNGTVRAFYSPIIRNNAIVNSFNGNGGYAIADVNNGEISNNYIKHVKKNLLFNKMTACSIFNNVLTCDETYGASYPNNKYLDNSDEHAAFTCADNDNWFRPCENSPLLGYASDGGDCGPFGGAYPYVISGLPQGVPYYTNVMVGGIAHDGKVNVSLTIGMQNE